MNDKKQKLFLDALSGKISDRVPFWFMRQAGRYLPEYRELRAKSGGFLDLVYNPENAAEVTIQPLRRFGMSAAILFSDILVVPQAMGQNLRFETGEGPKLDPVRTLAELEKLSSEGIDKILSPIYETISRVQEKLRTEGFDDTALIGFAGSPWTVACYMVEGGGSKTFDIVKKLAHDDPEFFSALIDRVTTATIHYLSKQIAAGAEAIQLFDSWAGTLDDENFRRWVIEPTQKIVNALKTQHPFVPIIGFPRISGDILTEYVENTGVTALGLDYNLPIGWAKTHIQPLCPVQGNLDPEILLAGGAELDRQAHKILETFSEDPFIFNLGHGVIKETPIEHVEQLSWIIRNYKL